MKLELKSEIIGYTLKICSACLFGIKEKHYPIDNEYCFKEGVKMCNNCWETIPCTSAEMLECEAEDMIIPDFES